MDTIKEEGDLSSSVNSDYGSDLIVDNKYKTGGGMRRKINNKIIDDILYEDYGVVDSIMNVESMGNHHMITYMVMMK